MTRGGYDARYIITDHGDLGGLLDDDHPQYAKPSDIVAPDIVVAASNSSEHVKKIADYVCDGVDDQVEIQAAIDSFSGPGRILLAEGLFSFSSGITIPSSFMLLGMGWNTVLKIAEGASSFTLISNDDPTGGNSSIAVRDLKIDGSYDLNAGTGYDYIKLDNCSYVKVNNIYVTNAETLAGVLQGPCIQFISSQYGDFSNNWFVDSRDGGILISDSSFVNVIKNYGINLSSAISRVVLVHSYEAETKHVHVENNFGYNCGDEGIFAWAQGSVVSHINIFGNTVVGCGDEGIGISALGGVGEITDVICENNICKGNLIGIKVELKAKNIKIKNNECTYNEQAGIYVGGSNDNIWLEDNTAHSNNQVGRSHSNIGIYGSSGKLVTNVRLTGNIVRKGTEANKPVYGIELNQYVDGVVFGNNDTTDGGETGDVNYGSASNISYLPELAQMDDPPEPLSYKTLRDYIDVAQHSAIITKNLISDNGDGTVTVGAGEGIIKETDIHTGKTVFFSFSEDTNVILTDNAMNYIYVDYNGGSPVIQTTNTLTDINNYSQILLGKVYRIGTILQILEAQEGLIDALSHQMQRFAEVKGFERANGLILGETGTRNISVTEGVVWFGLIRRVLGAIDTSSGDSFYYWYRDGNGGHTSLPAQTQIDNTKYDDDSGTLADLGNNNYGVHWVYVDYAGNLHVQFGQGDYNKIANAKAATVPTPPDFLSHFGMLVGRVIIEEGASSFDVTESAFEIEYTGVVVTDHDDLANLQGGTSGEYYHLTSAQHDNVLKREVQLVPFEWTSPVSTGDGKFYFHIGEVLDGKNLNYCHAEVITAGTTGTLEIQIHNVTKAVDMLSTTLQIDSGETGSDTAATSYVIDTNNDDVAENDVLRIDIDAVQTTPPEGLIVTLGFL